MTVPARRRIAPLAGLAAVALAGLTACSAGGAGTNGDQGTSPGTGQGAAMKPVAVATTTQLGSVLADITACAGTSSVTVMGPGDDPHDFSPSSQQIALMTEVDLVVANGLGLEAGMQTALDNAEADGARLLEVAPAVDPLPFRAADGHEHAVEGEDGHEQAAGSADPHFWMDVGRMAMAAELIGGELAEVTDDQQYLACGQEVAASLDGTDEEIAQILSGIPEDARTLVADHAAYNYFADAYGMDIAGIVVPGGSTDAEPSSERLATLVTQMEQQGADALVTSAGAENALVEALSAETDGAVPVVELHEGGVGPEGSDAETYEKAMVHNARTLAEALQ